VDNSDPAKAGFVARGREIIAKPGRTLEIRASIDILSDLRFFHVTVRRSLVENGLPIRERSWTESIPRDFH
jgi:hypothetical protein